MKERSSPEPVGTRLSSPKACSAAVLQAASSYFCCRGTTASEPPRGYHSLQEAFVTSEGTPAKDSHAVQVSLSIRGQERNQQPKISPSARQQWVLEGWENRTRINAKL